jgi:hypothetical protein
MEAPILHVPNLQERRQQPEKPLILELLTEDPEHHFMIYTVQRPNILIPLSTTHQ